MTDSSSPNAAHDQEAQPEFEAKLRAVMQEWQNGDLPFVDAGEQITTLLGEATVADHPANIGRAETYLGIMQGHRGNYQIAIQHFDNSRAAFERLGNTRRMMIADLNLGETYRLKGDYRRAQRKFKAAIREAQKIEDIHSEITATVNEGLMLLNMKQMTSARTSFERGQGLIQQWMDSRDNTEDEAALALLSPRCEIAYGMALVHLDAGDPQQAFESAKQAIALAEHSDKMMQGKTNRIMGEILTQLNPADLPPANPDDTLPRDAAVYFQNAYTIFNEMSAEADLARTFYAHALYLIQEGNKMGAARRLQRAIIIFAKRGMTQEAAQAAEAQAQVL
jgi:tetratricopeptide (TPR) repeat protein